MINKDKALGQTDLELYKNINDNHNDDKHYLMSTNNIIQLINNLKNTPVEFQKTFLENIENILA